MASVELSDPGAEPSTNSVKRSPRLWRKVQLFVRRSNFLVWLEVLLAITLIVMLTLSYLTIVGMADGDDLVPSAQAAAMLVGTLIPAMGLLVLFGRRRAIRRAGTTTARLHVNLVFFFSLMSAIPTLLVAVFASFLFQSGVEFWFSDDSRGLMENANSLAEGYYNENQGLVGEETVTMASDLRYFLERESLTSPDFPEFYVRQVSYRKLDESAIIRLAGDGNLRIEAIVDPDEDEARERISDESLARLQNGETLIILASMERIEAITPLDPATGLYLYNAVNSDAAVISQWQRAQNVAASYISLTDRARSLQLQFNIALFGVSLALVGLSVWIALRFADRQVKPLAELVTVAKEIGNGNYAMRVSGRQGPDEIGLLNRAFNRMTSQIETQTDALLGANRQLADRRSFIEAVLESITAGIISIDTDGNILLMNSSAQNLLLKQSGPAVHGMKLEKVAPQIYALLGSGSNNGIVQYNSSGELLTLAVNLASSTDGYVITFEDITRQLVDQRQAAWSDVARRIAHEIKNPLTPIQLATERLNRRYRKQILQDGELFDELTGTIIRQVASLRKMVDEFSSFARLPKPVFRHEDAVDLVRQSLFLQEVAHPDNRYVFTCDDDIPQIECDRHQFGQSMTNVLKNAAEALQAKRKNSEPDYRGRVDVNVSFDGEAEGGFLKVSISDNGVGLTQNSDRIMEPYVTTREKGTGLGLAIVKKIVEEHGGDIAFAPTEESGTRVILRFAANPANISNPMEIAGRSETSE